MADLDKIVRPFQLRPRAAALSEKVLEVRKPGTPVTIRSGGSGKGKQLSCSLTADLKLFHEDTVRETADDR
jgi:hypothetical protein